MDNSGPTEEDSNSISPCGSPATDEEDRLISNDEIQRLQEYLPLIDLMIKKISEQPGTPREAQLKKLKHLRELFLDTKKQSLRFKVGTAKKCEMVLMNFKKILKDGSMAAKFPPPVFSEDSNSRSSSSVEREQRPETSRSNTSNCQLENQPSTSKREKKATKKSEYNHKSSVRDDKTETKKSEKSSARKSQSSEGRFLKIQEDENHESLEESRNSVIRERKASDKESFQSRLDKRFVFGKKPPERNSLDNNSNKSPVVDDSHNKFPSTSNCEKIFPIVNNHSKFTDFVPQKNNVELEPETSPLHDNQSPQSRWSERTLSTEDTCEDNSRIPYEKSSEKKENSRKLIRDMLAKQIDVVHKVGESKGGALRALIHKDGDMKSPPKLDLSNKDKAPNPFLKSPTYVMNSRPSDTTDERAVPGLSSDNINVKKNSAHLFSENKLLKNCDKKINAHDQPLAEKQLKDKRDTSLLNSIVKDPRLKVTSNGFANKHSILSIQESRNSFPNKSNILIKKPEDRPSSYSDANYKQPKMACKDPRLNSGNVMAKRPETPYPTFPGRVVCPPPPKISTVCPPPPKISTENIKEIKSPISSIDPAEIVKKTSILSSMPIEDLQRIVRENEEVLSMVKTSNVSAMQHGVKESVHATHKRPSIYSLNDDHTPINSKDADIHAISEKLELDMRATGHFPQTSLPITKNVELNANFSRAMSNTFAKPVTNNKPSLLPFPFPQNPVCSNFNLPNSDFASHISPIKQLRPPQTNVLPSPSNKDLLNAPQSPLIISPITQAHMSPAYKPLLSPISRSSQPIPSLLPPHLQKPSLLLDVPSLPFQGDTKSQLEFQHARYAPVHYDYNHSSQQGRSPASWGNDNQQRKTFSHSPESPPSVNWPPSISSNSVGYAPQAHRRDISERDPRVRNDNPRRSFEMSADENRRDLDWCPPSPFETGDPNFRPKTPVANREFSRPKTPINREFNRPKTPIDNREFFRSGTPIDSRDFRSKTPVDNANFRSKTPVDNANFRSKTPVDNANFRSKTPVDNASFRSKTPVDNANFRSKTPINNRDFRSNTQSDNRNFRSKPPPNNREYYGPKSPIERREFSRPKTPAGRQEFSRPRTPYEPYRRGSRNSPEREHNNQKPRSSYDLNKNMDQKCNGPKHKDELEIRSPLCSLYGTVTIPKTGKGYGFQSFRIPKKVRPPEPEERRQEQIIDTIVIEEEKPVLEEVDKKEETETSMKHTEHVDTNISAEPTATDLPKGEKRTKNYSKPPVSGLSYTQPDLVEKLIPSTSNMQTDLARLSARTSNTKTDMAKASVSSTSSIQPDAATTSLESSSTFQLDEAKTSVPSSSNVQSDVCEVIMPSSSNIQPDPAKMPVPSTSNIIQSDLAQELLEVLLKKSFELEGGRLFEKLLPKNYKIIKKASDSDSEDSESSVKSKHGKKNKKMKHKKESFSESESDSSKREKKKKSDSLAHRKESLKKSKSKVIVSSDDELEYSKKVRSKKVVPLEDESELSKKPRSKKLVVSEDESESSKKSKSRKSVMSEDDFDSSKKTKSKKSVLPDNESESTKTEQYSKKAVVSQNQLHYNNKAVIKQEILSESDELEENRQHSSDDENMSDVPLAFISSASPTRNTDKKCPERSVSYRPGPKSKKKDLKVVNVSSSAYNDIDDVDTDDLKSVKNENSSKMDIKSKQKKHNKHKRSKKTRKRNDSEVKDEATSTDEELLKKADTSYDSLYDSKEGQSNDEEQFNRLCSSESRGSSPRKYLKRRDPVARLHEDVFDFPFSDTNMLEQRSCRSKVAYGEEQDADDDDSLLGGVQLKDQKVVPDLTKKREYFEKGKKKRGGRRRRSKKSDDLCFRNNAEAVSYFRKIRRQLYRNPTKELRDSVYEEVEDFIGQPYVKDVEPIEYIFMYTRKVKPKILNTKVSCEIERLYTNKNIKLSGNMLQDILARYTVLKNKKKPKTKKSKNSSFFEPSVCVKTEPPEICEDDITVKVERMSPTNIDTGSSSNVIESYERTKTVETELFSQGLAYSQPQQSNASDKNLASVSFEKDKCALNETHEPESKESSQMSNDTVTDDDDTHIPITTFEFETEVEIKCNTPVPEENHATSVPEEHLAMLVPEEHCTTPISEERHDILVSDELHKTPVSDEHHKTSVLDEHHSLPVSGVLTVQDKTSVPDEQSKTSVPDEQSKTSVLDEHLQTLVPDEGHKTPVLVEHNNKALAEKSCVKSVPEENFNISVESRNIPVSKECCNTDVSEKSPVSEGHHNEHLTNHNEQLISVELPPIKIVRKCVKYEMKGKSKKRKTKWQYGILKKKSPVKAKLDITHSRDILVSKPTADIVSTDCGTKEGENLGEEKLDLLELHNLNSIKTLNSKTNMPLNNFADKSYSQSDNQAVPCKLCNFFGTRIVKHYKASHPGAEVSISRFEEKQAESILKEAKKFQFMSDYNSDEMIALSLSLKDLLTPAFHCRLCKFKCNTFSMFFDHITIHTGEYRYGCNLCDYLSGFRKSVKTHLQSHHSGVREMGKNVSILYELPVIPSECCLLIAHMCSTCNFVQLQRENVERHIRSMHDGNSEAEIVCVNMVNNTHLSELAEEYDKGGEKLDVEDGKENEELLENTEDDSESMSDNESSTKGSSQVCDTMKITKQLFVAVKPLSLALIREKLFLNDENLESEGENLDKSETEKIQEDSASAERYDSPTETTDDSTLKIIKETKPGGVSKDVSSDELQQFTGPAPMSVKLRKQQTASALLESQGESTSSYTKDMPEKSVTNLNSVKEATAVQESEIETVNTSTDTKNTQERQEVEQINEKKVQEGEKETEKHKEKNFTPEEREKYVREENERLQREEQEKAEREEKERLENEEMKRLEEEKRIIQEKEEKERREQEEKERLEREERDRVECEEREKREKEERERQEKEEKERREREEKERIEREERERVERIEREKKEKEERERQEKEERERREREEKERREREERERIEREERERLERIEREKREKEELERLHKVLGTKKTDNMPEGDLKVEPLYSLINESMVATCKMKAIFSVSLQFLTTFSDELENDTLEWKLKVEKNDNDATKSSSNFENGPIESNILTEITDKIFSIKDDKMEISKKDTLLNNGENDEKNVENDSSGVCSKVFNSNRMKKVTLLSHNEESNKLNTRMCLLNKQLARSAICSVNKNPGIASADREISDQNIAHVSSSKESSSVIMHESHTEQNMDSSGLFNLRSVLSDFVIFVGPLQAKRVNVSPIVYLCHTNDCQFVTSYRKDFKEHVETQHRANVWNGYCYSCGSVNIFNDGNLNSNYPLPSALCHLFEGHLLPMVAKSMNQQMVPITSQMECDSNVPVVDVSSSVSSVNMTVDTVHSQTESEALPNANEVMSTGDGTSLSNDIADNDMGSIRIESVVSLHPEFQDQENNVNGCSNTFLPNDNSTSTDNATENLQSTSNIFETSTNKPNTDAATVDFSSITLYSGNLSSASVEIPAVVKSIESETSKSQSIKILTPFTRAAPGINILSKQVKGSKNSRTILQTVSSPLSSPLITSTISSPISKLGIMSPVLKGSDHVARITVLSTSTVTAGLNSLTKTMPGQTLTPVSSIQNLLTTSGGSSFISLQPVTAKSSRAIKIVSTLQPVDKSKLTLSPKKTTIVAVRDPKSNELTLVSPKKQQLKTVPQFKKLLPRPTLPRSVFSLQRPLQKTLLSNSLQPSVKLLNKENDTAITEIQEKNDTLQLVPADSQKFFSDAFYQLRGIMQNNRTAVFAWKTAGGVYTVGPAPDMLPNKTLPKADKIVNSRSIGKEALNKFLSNLELNASATISATFGISDSTPTNDKTPEQMSPTDKQTEKTSESVTLPSNVQVEPITLSTDSLVLQKDSENQESTSQIKSMDVSNQSSPLEKDSETFTPLVVSQTETSLAVLNVSSDKSSHTTTSTNSQPNELDSWFSTLLNTPVQDFSTCNSLFSDVSSTPSAECTSSNSILSTLLNNPVTVSAPIDSNIRPIVQSVMSDTDIPLVSSTDGSASSTDMLTMSCTNMPATLSADKVTVSNTNELNLLNTSNMEKNFTKSESQRKIQEGDVSEITECDISSENFSIQIAKINSKTFDFIIPSLSSSETVLDETSSSDSVPVENNKNDSLFSSPTKTRSFSSPSSSYVFFKGHFLHKCLVSPIIVKHTKGAFAFRGMIVTSKLVHLYKCMSRFCTFSTNSKSSFLSHFNSHSLIKVDEDSLDFQRCPYCCTVHSTANAYMDHIENEHGHSNYQCLYCFFRAASQCFVLLHQNTHHKQDRAAVLFCPSTSAPPLPESITCLYEDAPAFKCIEGTCNLGFFEWNTFLAHLTDHHSSADSYQCHICKEKLANLDTLNKHCSKRYHCLYCKKSASLENEIHSHLYRRHPNQRCRAVERIKRDDDAGGECLSSVTFHRGVSFSDSIVFPPEEFAEPALENPEVATDNSGSTVESDTIVDKDSSAAKQDNNISKTNLPQNTVTGDTTEKEPVTSDKSTENRTGNKLAKDTNSKISEKNDVEIPVLIDLTAESDDDSDIEIISCEIFKKYDEVIDLCDDEDDDKASFFLNKENKVSGNEELSSINDLMKAQSSSQVGEEDEDVEMADALTENSEDSRTTADLTSEKLDCVDGLQKFGRTTELSGSDLYVCGNTDCTYKTHASSFFKNHSLICDFGRHTKGLVCAHCKKTCKNLKSLLDHLMIHGEKRYLCGICDYKAPKPQFVVRHMKKKHKVTDAVIKAKDPFQTNPDTAVFTVYSKSRSILRKALDIVERSSVERQSVEKASVEKDEYEVIVIDDSEQSQQSVDKEENPLVKEKTIKYGPEDIEKLPEVPIFTSIVTCAICSFTTSVQKNFIRHLKMHRQTSENEGDSNLPCEQPINPPPCLNNVEMMFDKMTNLAASSHYGGSAVNKRPQDYMPTPEEEELIPKYIAPNKRYVCRLDGCDYLSCDQLLLKYHVRALHFNSTEYTCPHCPDYDVNATMPIDKMATHLKMHGGRLFKCVYCSYYHFQRHTIEKHVTDKHIGQMCAVFIVRDSEDGDQEPPPVLKVIIVNKEVVEKKSEKTSKSATWMCGFCDVRCNTRGEIIDHAASKHGQRSQYRCCLCSYKSSAILSMATHFSLKHPGKDAEFLHAYKKVPPGSQREVTPQPAATAANLHVPESVPVIPVPEIRKPSPSDASPLWSRNLRKGCLRSIRGILIEDDSDAAKDTSKESLDDVIKKIGPLGEPSDDKRFLCPLCHKFKTLNAQDLKFHLYMELNYVKWACGHCGITSFFRAQLERHSAIIREKEGKKIDLHQLPPNEGIELWVDKVVDHQFSKMKALKQSRPPVLSPQKTHAKVNIESTQSKVNIESTQSKPTTPNTPEVTTKILLSTEPATSIEEPEMPTLNPADSSASTSTSPEAPSGQDQQPVKHYDCRSCSATFLTTRGLKLHVRINHLKLARWQCAHCDWVSNSESAVINHGKKTHQYLQPCAIYNEKYDAFKIDPKFWKKFYGLDSESEAPKYAKVKTDAGKYRKIEMKKPKKLVLPNTAKSNAMKSDGEVVKRKLDELDSFGNETGCKSPPVTPIKVPKTNVAMEQCDYCEYVGNLNNHLANHGVMRIFNCLCLGCVVYTDSQSSIDQHLSDVHKSVPFYCWKFIEKEPSAVRKRKLDGLDGPMSAKNKMCYYCNKTVLHTQIITHCRQNHSRDVPRSAFFMCPQCMFATVELQTAREHIKTQHLKATEIQEINSCMNTENTNESSYDQGERCTYSCTLCVFRTDNLEDLIKHLKKCHNANFACEVCFKTFNSHEDATNHFRSEHSRGWVKIIDLRYSDITNKSDSQVPPKESNIMPEKRALFTEKFDSNSNVSSSVKIHVAKKSTSGIRPLGPVPQSGMPSSSYCNVSPVSDDLATCMVAKKSTSGIGRVMPSGMLSPKYSDINSVTDGTKTGAIAKKSTSVMKAVGNNVQPGMSRYPGINSVYDNTNSTAAKKSTSGMKTFGLNSQTEKLSHSDTDDNPVVDDTTTSIQTSYSLFQKSLSDLGKALQNTVRSSSRSNSIAEELPKQNFFEIDNMSEETFNVNHQARNAVAKKSTSKQLKSIYKSLPVARKSTSSLPFKDVDKLQNNSTIYYSPSYDSMSSKESHLQSSPICNDVNTEKISPVAKKSTGGVTLTLSKRATKRSRSGSSFFDKEAEDSISDRFYDKSCVEDQSGRLILKLSVRNNKVTNKSKIKSKKLIKKKGVSPISGKEFAAGSKKWPFKRKIFKGRKTSVKNLLFEGVSGFVKVSDMMKSFNMLPRVELQKYDYVTC